MKYKRVLLKLSGEAFGNKSGGLVFDFGAVNRLCREIRNAVKKGVEVGVVTGGGNIFRGAGSGDSGISRLKGDYIGMLATVINSLVLESLLRNSGCGARVLSAIETAEVAETFTVRGAEDHFTAGRAVIFAGGTGNPYFSTDSAAALRASEMRADVLLKATKVDGVYSSDPEKDPDARFYRNLSYDEAIRKSLKVMDAAAFSICRENGIPIVVFNFEKEGMLEKALNGEDVGTLVSA
ncbi:MAG: UMP kinase [Kiritimatiellia bacterium]